MPAWRSVIGGVAGILAGIVGATVIGPSGSQVVAIMTKATVFTDGPEKGALMQRAAALRQRIKGGTRLVIKALQATALLLMSVGHYV